MGGFLKILILFGIVYFGYRMITKPFRDYVKATKKQDRFNTKKSQKKSSDNTKTEDLGDYIDYEEVE